ncbi:ADP-ribosylation factor-like protein 13A isoform X4 [Nerophis lumbriciformis]|uniref:ADP-ribosylation factor-like protein 13A isoform X4 n=1 Tax=Nerophis lumbriciformis TaxID=546530 RepID=UPI002AE05326|nr:ADP-ribosylation factor-like protein 13B isoform X5 [Nerophis lumbriciformis]
MWWSRGLESMWWSRGLDTMWQSRGLESMWWSRGLESMWWPRGLGSMWWSRGLESMWWSRGLGSKWPLSVSVTEVLSCVGSLANKQDKMKALLGSDLTEMLSLEKLVNQSRCLCHIEPCSALMDIRRRSDRKTLRGLRWLLRAVCLDYLQLSTRVVQDSKSPLGPPERTASKNKRERLRGSQCDMKSKDNKDKDMKSKDHKDKDNKDKDMKSKDKAKRSKGEMLQKEQTLKKKMKKSARRKKSLVEANEDKDKEQEEEEEEEEDLLPPSSKSRPKGKTKVNEETLEVPEWTHEDDEPLRADGRRSKKKKKKKKKKVKKRSNNKINTEEMSHHVHLPATLDLYRKAILALKERQAERQ